LAEVEMMTFLIVVAQYGNPNSVVLRPQYL